MQHKIIINNLNKNNLDIFVKSLILNGYKINEIKVEERIKGLGVFEVYIDYEYVKKNK